MEGESSIKVENSEDCTDSRGQEDLKVNEDEMRIKNSDSETCNKKKCKHRKSKHKKSSVKNTRGKIMI